MGLQIRVLLADDHAMVRAGLRALLAQSRDLAVVGEALDGRDAVRQMRALSPDIVLMDIGMPGLNGLEATVRALRLRPAPKVVILSMHATEGYVRAALRAGASGYVLKSAEIEELERAIRAVAGGARYLSSALPAPIAASILLAEPGEDAHAPLTSRQLEVLQLVAEGRTSRAIAERLCLSIKTVETHRAHLIERLGIGDVAGLTRYALRMGLIPPES